MKSKERVHDIVSECYMQSVRLLLKNSGPDGINAASRTKRSEGRYYANIFGRDAAICSLGMAVSGDPQLIASAKHSLLTLAEYQAPNGQVPKFVTPENQKADFWYTGCIDATLWWLIAVAFYDRQFPHEHLKKRLQKNITSALFWLQCQEHQGLHLLQQNEASDWADIMPRSGFVLYSNALWYHVKILFNLGLADKTEYYFRYLFSPFDKVLPEQRRARVMAHYIKKDKKPSEFYLSFVNLSFWGPDIDVYGNILAMLFGLSPVSRSSMRVNRLLALEVNQPFPIRVVSSPIRKNSPLWRPYMERYKQNYPNQYHNGGIWPYVAGFWIMLLHRLGRKKLAKQELKRYAEINKTNDWEFNEWFHGKTGRPMGMPGQSWNASMFILACHFLKDEIKVF